MAGRAPYEYWGSSRPKAPPSQAPQSQAFLVEARGAFPKIRLGNFTSQLFELLFRVFRADFAENRGESGKFGPMLEINT